MNERGSVGPWPWLWPRFGGGCGGPTVDVGICRLAGDMAGSIRGRCDCGGICSDSAVSASIDRAFGVVKSAVPSNVRSSSDTCAACNRLDNARAT